MSFDKYIYEKAENEVKQNRFRAEREAEERALEAERKIPEIKEISNELSRTSIELSKLILKNKGDFKENFEKIKNRNIQGQEMIRSLLTRNGYPADYLEPRYSCVKCCDKGFYEGQRCSCFERLLTRFAVEKLNSEANMPDCDFEHFSLSYYEGRSDSGVDCFKRMSENLEFCRQYAERFSTNSSSLFLLGKTGIGKTHISLSIAKEVIKRGFTVAYGSLLNYLRIIEKEHFGRSENPETDTLQILIGADLLILDDLGSEFRTSFYESVIYNIVNSRINLGLPTIISSNLSVPELQKNYNDRIISRLFSVYHIIPFVGEDIRQIKRLNEEF
ncbi:MAG: ATP-binding protein [Oscillospiraceae bacterium]|jgi:DNA replication protein DnaC|nr:ATP-binding protein [Oscillospiraceae bacterium]